MTAAARARSGKSGADRLRQGDLQLGVIGNSIVAALIDKYANIVWHCVPRLDGDPVLCRLLEPKMNDGDGMMSVELRGLAEAQQSYIDNTAVLVTTLTDEQGGSIRITDFAPRFKQYDRMYRPAMLIRRIETVAGTPVIRIRVRPLFDYGATQPSRTLGSNHIRFTAPGAALRLTTDAPIAFIDNESEFVLTQSCTLILGPDESFTESLQHISREFLERTIEYWIEWVRYLSVPFEWQDAVIRAAITLKLCSCEETGAIVAALTTSIPEAANTPRNWDYRFCWMRDAYFVVQALNRLGATKTMEDFLRYITTVVAQHPGEELQPVYGIVPNSSMEERTVPSLRGYRGMGPVRVGNAAFSQRQNDTYGSIVLAVAQMFFDHRLPRRGDAALFRQLEGLGEKAAALALVPDAGLWEFRGRERVHTHSAAMCWAACRRLAKIAGALDLSERAAYWRDHADRIRKAILDHAWNAERNSFVESFGGHDLDASLLLLQEIGFVAADDPRFLGTVEAIGAELRRGNHLMRYVVPDDFGRPHTAFTICTFWYVDALAATGRREEARAIFETLLASRNRLGMLSEDIDPRDGSLWGNFPQTYSMVGLIVCAMRLSKSWEEAFWRGS
ncbi:MAG TPA: glycoside hydrolase family 15 protein [Ferrovibrio sp.]|uniref:glycoside hydrolase family 15 protein n=1 Tax=Ferrovibrio sp. TaxID=1917215 RepID=UPI002ED22B0F